MMSNRLPILAAEIRKAQADVQEAAKTAAEKAIDAGRALIEAKGLVKHGEWQPWLREHCALAERTARLYMQIARSGHEAATVAVLGLNAAAKAIALQYPDPFDDLPQEELKEWQIHGLWLLRQGVPSEGVAHRCEWLKRNGWTSPSEWIGEVGDRLRKLWGMRSCPDRTKAEWFAFLAENHNRTNEDIDAEARRLIEAEPPMPSMPMQKRRRRANKRP